MTQLSTPSGTDRIPADRRIEARPLTPEAFAPFGHVARPGFGDVKAIRDGQVRLSKSDTAFAHGPAADAARLDFYEVAAERDLLVASMIERHAQSSQMFSPMGAAAGWWRSGPTAPRARRWPSSPGRRTW